MGDEVMGAVKVRQAVVPESAVLIGGGGAVHHILRGQYPRPGVRNAKLEALTESPVQRCLQAVVVGVRAVIAEVDVGIAGVGAGIVVSQHSGLPHHGTAVVWSIEKPVGGTAESTVQRSST